MPPRYAAMISAMTFSKAVEVYGRYLERNNSTDGAETALRQFLNWDVANEDTFGRDARIVLVSAEFSKEITTSVLWLNERALDIRCVRLRPYALEARVLLDVQQVIPLPEADAFGHISALELRNAVRPPQLRFPIILFQRKDVLNSHGIHQATAEITPPGRARPARPRGKGVLHSQHLRTPAAGCGSGSRPAGRYCAPKSHRAGPPDEGHVGQHRRFWVPIGCQFGISGATRRTNPFSEVPVTIWNIW